MLKVGITGQTGFIGKHLYNTLGLYQEEFERIEFKKEYFSDDTQMDHFIATCDVIVHLAALNRHNDPQTIYNTNVDLVNKLTASLRRCYKKTQVIFSSSTQEERDNLYGKSKLTGRNALAAAVEENGGSFAGLIIPNVFGPFGNPYYNSVVATFCHQISHDEIPVIEIDGELKLIYVGELIDVILSVIRNKTTAASLEVPFTHKARVSEILALLQTYHKEYQLNGVIPALHNNFERNLFNTFRCYMDIPKYFPVKFKQHTDPRGAFVEVIRLNTGGQVSYSTTVPGITRGNHFHTRKIERFAVIKGEALIQLRRIGTDEVLDFYLSGNEPAYVDMPVWYTHNIRNIGTEELFTIFWINEFFDAADPDTYMEIV
ncbi:NAD-dependent epimerase/dehydratase family protein [Chitinophaga solisilvae]|uniref:polysaccharide biosynthesis C-terminal domain-containing protein n=1 Tax=Chitinophaga solisilvae TaxID=1233460 RepID=UPI00136FFA10|nr:NAD-dependent epimerase/dehydratase family protein [Chitinophaga solisilvae]